MKYYLGLLCLSTKSYAALSNENGDIITFINAPPLTLQVDPQLRNHLYETINQLSINLGINYDDLIKNIKYSCISMSGLYTENSKKVIMQILFQLGFSKINNIVLCENGHAHLATELLSHGGVVRAGTGSLVFIRSKYLCDTPIRVDGWGSLLGDDGSGYDLGRKCLRVLFKAEDKRKPGSSILKNRVLDYIGLNSKINDIYDLVQWHYDIRYTVGWRSSISNLAVPLREAAENDKDPLAYKIMMSGINSLIDSFNTAIELMQSKNKGENTESIPLILHGGLFNNSKIYNSQFRKYLSELPPSNIDFKVIKPELNSVVGCLALAISRNEFIDKTCRYHCVLRESATRLKIFYNKHN